MITAKNILRKLGLTLTELQNLDVSEGTPGTVGVPTAGTVVLTTERFGSGYISTFTLTAARLVVTDAGASGAWGTLKLLDFPEGYIRILGASGKYTAFAEGAALTTAAGDAAFVLGLGTTAQVVGTVGDGTFGTATDHDILAKTSTITLSSGTGTGKHATATNLMYDGTTTALDLNLNFSGSAATCDATSYINITGVIKVIWVNMIDAA